MKQSLQLKIGQQLTMTPQLQQAIRLLQLSTLDLQAEIQEALESNPMLEANEETPPEAPAETQKQNEQNTNTAAAEESTANEKSSGDSQEHLQEGEDFNQNDNWNDNDIPSELSVDTSWDDVYQSASAPTGLSRPENDDFDYDSRRGTSESLQDYLSWQLNLTPLSEVDKFIGEAIIDAVQPSGMLSHSIEDIYEGLKSQESEAKTDDLDADSALELDEMFAVLHRIQQFDPPGVASQSISECLLIQLNQLGIDNSDVRLAREIIRNHLDTLGSRDFKQLMRKLKVKEPELQEAIKVIQALNPRPGENIGTDNTEYVVPDVFVSKIENRWSVSLNPEIAPKLRINSDYASLVKRADTSADNTFLRDNLQEARWFLKSLQSRNETLLKVATCIVERQQGFLDHGPEAMKPMVLHDVAEMVEMHESTISRVTTQKYMHTPQGIFELKYFFSSHVATDAGGECSSTAIRAIIKKLVAAENTRKPLSDSKITGLLAEQGIKVARRTIAKYRESLGIPPSNERKRLV